MEQSVGICSVIEEDDLGELLLAMADAIVDNIADHNDEPDEIGIKRQRIYKQNSENLQ